MIDLKATRAIDGRWATGRSTVWWRLGTAPADEAPGAVARRWVEGIVRTKELFPWRGFVDTEPYTKPRFAMTESADFSISHSGRTVLVAVAMDGRVGVDVENAPFVAFGAPGLRSRMLAHEERNALRSVPVEEANAYLARVWTAKEARVKATGEGQKLDFRLFTVPALLTARPQAFEGCVALVSERKTRFLRLTLPAHLS